MDRPFDIFFERRPECSRASHFAATAKRYRSGAGNYSEFLEDNHHVSCVLSIMPEFIRLYEAYLMDALIIPCIMLAAGE
jgi:hypothetical protein